LSDTNGVTNTATATINLANMVWYVKNDATAGGLGRSNDPFDTLAEADAAHQANHYVFVYHGNGTNSGLNTGITLKNGVKLHGEGINLVAGGTTLATGNAANKPLVTHTTGNGVTVLANTANGDRTGVEIRGLSLSTTGAGFNAIDVTSANANNVG